MGRQLKNQGIADRHKRVDQIEQEMSKMEQILCPVSHVFTPGLYTRIIRMPAGTIVTSEIHKTEHPFFILQGLVEVGNVDTGKTVILSAPHIGVTKPNTRRVLNVIEETVWATVHVTKETDIEKIGDKILVKRDNGITPQYKKEAMKGIILDKKLIKI